MVARDWGKRVMGGCLMGTEVQFCNMKIYGDGLHNNVNVLNCWTIYLKMVKMLYVF